MSDPVLIDDGLTLEGYIAPIPRLHGAVRFKYRIFMQRQRANLLHQIAKSTAEEAEGLAAMAVENKILEWDVKQSDGKPAPITENNVLKLHPRIGNRLYRIVMADEAPDAPDEESTPSANGDSRSDFLAALKGKQPDEEREKNSSAV